MYDKKIYSLRAQFGSLVWGRNMAIALRNQIVANDCETAIVDFEGVSMVTRAFVDELMKVKQFLEKKGRVVLFINNERRCFANV